MILRKTDLQTRITKINVRFLGLTYRLTIRKIMSYHNVYAKGDDKGRASGKISQRIYR